MPFVHRHRTVDTQQRGQQQSRGQPGQGYGHVGPQRRMPQAYVVMVFPYKTSALVRYGDAEMEEETRGLHPATPEQKTKMDMWAMKRHGIITALSDCGLVLMLYYSRDRDEIFVKLAADEFHLRQVAEMKRHRLELKEQYLSAFAEYKNDYPGRRDLGYSDRRVVSHLYKPHLDETDDFKGKQYPNPGAIFKTIDKITLIDYIVRQSDHHCAGLDVGQYMHDNDILHYYPLHENRKLVALDNDWFRCFAWGGHIDKVRDYFGERIALYFLFMSHLNSWLIMPSVFGVLLWILELFHVSPIARTIYCVLAGVWCTLFVHFWRRKAAMHSIKWGTLGMGQTLEQTRAEFHGVARINPVTGRIDRYYPWSSRIKQVVKSYAVLSVSVIVLFFIISLLFLLRREFHSGGGRYFFQCLNAAMVELLNWVFTKIAVQLTEWENHRAYSEYANHLLAKTIIFKFINSYISLYYIAFFKEHGYLFGVEMRCVNDNCLNDLASQLAIFMLFRLVIGNMIELLLPWATQCYKAWQEDKQFKMDSGMLSFFGFTSALTVMPDMSSAEKQSKKDVYEPYEDMDEILILYGYTTLFVVACPWVPLLAWFSCILECFLDQKKLVHIFRRPFPVAAASNEPWDCAFDVFGILAMLTNAGVIIFASHAFVGYQHSTKIVIFLAVEHATILLRVVMSIIYPALPRRVKLLSLQQGVMVHRHLNLGGEEDDHETRASAMRTTPFPAPYVHDRDDEEDDW